MYIYIYSSLHALRGSYLNYKIMFVFEIVASSDFESDLRIRFDCFAFRFLHIIVI